MNCVVCSRWTDYPLLKQESDGTLSMVGGCCPACIPQYARMLASPVDPLEKSLERAIPRFDDNEIKRLYKRRASN